MKPDEAYQVIERISPMDLKNRLLDILGWQAKRQKSLVHVSWYLRRLQEPAMKFNPEISRLMAGIGK